mgnify:CR=1 FL=1
MKIPARTLVVVADGGGARVFRNVGDEQYLMLKQEELLELMNMNDDGPAGSMPTESSGEAIDEATFAKQLAQNLKPAHVRQVQVQQNEVVVIDLAQIDAFLAQVGRIDIEAFRLEHQLNALGCRVVVFDQQDAHSCPSRQSLG